MSSLALHQDIQSRRAVTECAAYGSLLSLSEDMFHSSVVNFWCFQYIFRKCFPVHTGISFFTFNLLF